MPNIRRILVANDFSSCSAAASRYAAYLADVLDVPLDVLHVIWEPPAYVGAEVMVDVSGQSRQTLARFAYSQAEKEMGGAIDELKSDFDVPMNPRLEFGDPTSTIIRVAEEDRYDLVVLGTHGRTGLSHLLMGSVAERVVRRCHTPALTVHDANCEPRDDDPKR